MNSLRKSRIELRSNLNQQNQEKHEKHKFRIILHTLTTTNIQQKKVITVNENWNRDFKVQYNLHNPNPSLSEHPTIRTKTLQKCKNDARSST